MRSWMWRLLLGVLLLGGVARGGTVGNPEWLGTAIDVVLFAIGVWLVFTAGERVAASAT